MKTKAVAQKTTFSGNVVEIYSEGDKHSTKILIKPVYLNIPVSDVEDIHLGDQLDLKCEFVISKITSHFSKKN